MSDSDPIEINEEKINQPATVMAAEEQTAETPDTPDALPSDNGTESTAVSEASTEEAPDKPEAMLPAVRPKPKKVSARSCTMQDSLRAALRLLDSSSREQWHHYGVALKRWGIEQNMEEAAWELFDEWSKATKADNYNAESNWEQWDLWETDESASPVTLEAIFEAAKLEGLDMRSVSSPENGRLGGRPPSPDFAEVAAYLCTRLNAGSGDESGPSLRFTSSGWREYTAAGWIHKTPGEITQILVTKMQQDKVLYKYCSRRFVSEVMMHLASYIYCGTKAPLGSWLSRDGFESAKHWMAFSNGRAVNVHNLAQIVAEKRLATEAPHEVMRNTGPNFFSKNFVPYAFSWAGGEVPLFARYLDRVIPDRNVQRMLQQLTGLALSDITHYEKMWFLTGSGANGKSVFADILTHLVGEKNVCHLDIQQIGQKYMSWPLTENKLNIAHDLAAANSSAMEKVEGVLKQVVSGQRLNVERKYENTHTGLCTARVVFVTNSLPAFSDQSDAIFRRTVIIPFLERIPLEEQDPTLTNQILTTELPAIFNWGVVGLADVLTNGVFESPASLEMKKRHFATCNRERDFLNSACERHRTGFVSSAQLYANYRVWSAECGCTPIALSSFCQTIETAFPEVERKQRSIEGERVRGYEGIRFVPGDHPENIPNPRPDPEPELVISSE